MQAGRDLVSRATPRAIRDLASEIVLREKEGIWQDEGLALGDEVNSEAGARTARFDDHSRPRRIRSGQEDPRWAVDRSAWCRRAAQLRLRFRSRPGTKSRGAEGSARILGCGCRTYVVPSDARHPRRPRGSLAQCTLMTAQLEARERG